MHEQSETIPSPGGGWINIYGQHTPQAGQVLPPRFPYEMPVYPNLQQADSAAAKRSFDMGLLIDAIQQRHQQAQQMMGKAPADAMPPL